MLVQCEGLLPPGSDLLELQNLMACGNLEMEFSVTKGEISLFSILNAFMPSQQLLTAILSILVGLEVVTTFLLRIPSF